MSFYLPERETQTREDNIIDNINRSSSSTPHYFYPSATFPP